MREIVLENYECNVCGSRAQVVRERLNVEARVVSFFMEFRDDKRSRAPRVRSGLAHAAGFAGVLCLFRDSLAPLALSEWVVTSGTWAWLLFAWSMFAPLALALAFAAGVSLDRSREKSGALPALFGFVVGLVATVNLLLTLAPPWLRYLKAF